MATVLVVFGVAVVIFLFIRYEMFGEAIKILEKDYINPVEEITNRPSVSKEENLKSENDRLTSELNAARMELSKYKSYRG